MNIHLPAILGFTRYQGFDPYPYHGYIMGLWDIPSVIKDGWEIPQNYRFIARKLLEAIGGFSRKPCLIARDGNLT